jgi:hypothetical protein
MMSLLDLIKTGGSRSFRREFPATGEVPPSHTPEPVSSRS